MTGARERQVAALERLRGGVRVTLRARRWLLRWRAISPRPWDAAESITMIANAVELSALTEFVAMYRAQDATDEV
ncbi:MAG TPA: hypothetical protein VFX16_19610 [Pseudonocardiaceae bacterium]|nr:hypothetical protein [Pseudonocardiaceae bacterium]